MQRRQFLGAAAVATTGVPLPVTDDGGETDNDEEDESEPDPVPARLSIFLEDAPLYLEAYPREDALAGSEVFLFTHSNEVFVGVKSDDGDRNTETGFYLNPDAAEEVADLLGEFAEKVRDGEEWVHP
jgi:hypothetical protein